MKMNRRTLLPIVLICLIVVQIGIVYADENISHPDVQVSYSTFAAGTHGNLGLTIQNGGDFAITDIEAFVTSAVPGVAVLNGSHKVIGSIDRNEAFTYNVTVMIDQNVVVGVYPLTMQLTYITADGITVQTAFPLTIEVNKQFLPLLIITTSPKELIAGSSNEITVSVSNTASANITNLALSLSTASPFLSIESPSNLNSMTIKNGEKTSFTVRVYALESTPIGPYTLTASTSYSSSSGDNYRQVATLPREVTALMITNIPVLTITNLNTTTALPGQQFTIHGRVDCNDASAYNTKATITLDAAGLLRPLSPTTISLGDLKTGDSKEFKCTVLVDGASAAAQIPTTLALSYTDSKGLQRTTTEVLTVQIGQIVDFEIMNPKLVNAEQGAQAKIDSSLILKGTSRVQFTNIDIVSDSDVQTTLESSFYIGAIYPDSPVLFTVKFNVPSTAGLGDTTIKLRVSYLDNLNAPRQQMLNYPITVIKPAASIGSDFWGWLRRALGMG